MPDDLEQYADAKRRDFLGQYWLSRLVQRAVDVVLCRKVIWRVWIPLRSQGRCVMATQYESTGSSARGYGPSRTTVIKIGPLYGEVPDLHSHDTIVDAAVNAAVEETMWFEDFVRQWSQRILHKGESSEAPTPISEQWEAFKQAKHEYPPYALERITDFSMSLLEQQHSEEAEDLLWWAWVGRDTEPGADDLGVTAMFGIHLLGLEYMRRTHYELAEKLLMQALDGSETLFGEDNPLRACLERDLTRLYETWGKPDKAAEWRSKAPQTQGTPG